MNENQWLAIVSIAACLVLVLSGYRSRGISFRQSALQIVMWGAIFTAVVIGFTMFGSV